MVKKVQKFIYRESKRIEMLPELQPDTPDELIHEYNYVFDRDITQYFYLLPFLERTVTVKSNILDIGGGYGVALRQIIDKYKCQGIMTCIQKPKEPLVEFVVCNATALPFPDSTFDIVTAVHSISWEPDQIKSFQEIIRVLKEGGTAHIFLVTFRHSISMRYGDNFWERGNLSESSCKECEFNPDDWKGSIVMVQAHNPISRFGEHKYAWSVLIHKPIQLQS